CRRRGRALGRLGKCNLLLGCQLARRLEDQVGEALAAALPAPKSMSCTAFSGPPSREEALFLKLNYCRDIRRLSRCRAHKRCWRCCQENTPKNLRAVNGEQKRYPSWGSAIRCNDL